MYEYISAIHATFADAEEEAAPDLQGTEIPREAAIAGGRALGGHGGNRGAVEVRCGDLLGSVNSMTAAAAGGAEHRTAGGRGG